VSGNGPLLHLSAKFFSESTAMGRKGKGRQLSRLAALPLISGYNKVRDSAYAIEGNRVYHTEVPSNRRPLLLGVVQEQRK
jgi:hypothetical protein